jgi:predicted unusual protein kinase regulating ubiquinone biosynthesis (AarF/ABC1/UbiB family)
MDPTHARPPRTSRLGRSLVVGKAAVQVGAQVGVGVLRRQLRPAGSDPQRDQAHAAAQEAAQEAELGRLLFAAMNQLRGTALKLAQVLSMDPGFLPEGVRRQLARATHQATPLNRALVGRVFRQAFGREPEALFARFEPVACAAASLGQVHRAWLPDGTALAVKLQYPGIAASIDSDLALLRAAMQRIGLERLGLPDAALLDQALEAVRRQLAEEVDYRHEAARQADFAARLRASPFGGGDGPGRLQVPTVRPEFSGRTVLTQHFVAGDHLDAWLQAAPAAATRDAQTQALFDWFTGCAFGDLAATDGRRIHADLHPGNFLFEPDGRVTLLDFGCTCALGGEFTTAVARSWRLWAEAGPAAAPQLLAVYQRLGLAAAPLEVARFEQQLLPILAPVLDWATQVFRADHFDFATAQGFALPLGAQRRAPVARQMADLPPQMLSLDRAWLGLMHLLTRLGGRIDTRAARERLQRAAAGP